MDVKPQERRSSLYVWLMWDGARSSVYICNPLSGLLLMAWVVFYALSEVEIVRVCMCMCVCVRLQCGDMPLCVMVPYHGALSNCTQEKADLQPHSTELSSS